MVGQEVVGSEKSEVKCERGSVSYFAAMAE